jgi:transcriptional regulator with XRE-family HTH domain
MKQSRASAKGPITKKIPLKSICVKAETNPRQKVSEDRVLFFRELYESPDHKIPPLEVLLIQSGDPKTCIYLVLDGLHRLEALKTNKAGEALCNVHNEKCYTLADLEEKNVLDAIFEMSCRYNIDGSTPLTRDERRDAAKRLSANGKYALERIAKNLGVHRNTVQRWLHDDREKSKADLKEEILEQLRCGESVNKLGRMYKDHVTEMTIGRWKREAGIGSEGGVTNAPNGAFVTLPGEGSTRPNGDDAETPKPLFSRKKRLRGLKRPRKAAPEGGTEESWGGEEAGKKAYAETMDSLVQITEALAPLEWFDDADDYILTEHLNALKRKSPRLAKALATGGLEDLYEEALSKYEEEKKFHEAARETSLERAAEIDKLKAELTSRKDHCKANCQHSKEEARKQMHRALSFLSDTVASLISALDKGSLVVKGAKKTIAVPREATEIIRQIALNQAYAAVGQFEMAVRNELYSPEAASTFYHFVELLESLGFHKNKDLMGRVKLVDQTFFKRETASHLEAAGGGIHLVQQI